MDNSRLNLIIRIATGLFILFVCWLKMTHNLMAHQDLLATDEAYYMLGGITLKGKMLKYWGPTYSLWYTFLLLFERDTIELYYLNQKLMGLLPVLAVFIMLLTYRVNFLISLVLSFFLLVSLVHFPTWPKISHFCMTIIAVSMICIRQFKSPYLKTVFIAFCALIISYARPEIYLALIILVVLLIGQAIFRRFKLTLFEGGMSLALIAMIALTSYFLGNSMFSKSDRNIVAFAQHYSLNYSIWNDLDIRNWMDYDNILKKEFGEVTSYSEALKANPQAFMKHIFSNSKNYIYKISNYGSDLVVSHKLVGNNLLVRLIIFFLIITIILIAYKKTWAFDRIKSLFSENAFSFFLLLILISPTLITCILIFPRDHYIYLQVPLFLLVVSLIFQNVKFGQGMSLLKQLPIILILGGIFYAVTPTAGQVNYFNFWKGEQTNNNIRAINKIKEICEDHEVRMAQSEGVLALFVRSKNFKVIQAKDFSNIQFLNHIRENDINLIYCSVMLLENPFIKGDREEWEQILESPQDHGWHKVVLTEGSREIMLIRNDLWKAINEKN